MGGTRTRGISDGSPVPASSWPLQRSRQPQLAQSAIRTGGSSGRPATASAALSRRNTNSKSYTSIVVRRLRCLPSDLAGVVHIGSSRSYQTTSRSLPMMPPREVGAAQPCP